jgi:hypothetical protein
MRVSSVELFGAGTPQHFQVLGHRRQAHGERLGELYDRRIAERKPRQDGAAGRIGQGGEEGVEVAHEPYG